MHLSVSPLPTQLDCEPGYALGHAAGLMFQRGLHGYVASVTGLLTSCEEWGVAGVPLARLMEAKQSCGAAASDVAVRRHCLTPGHALFDLWRKVKDKWRYRETYRQPGPVLYRMPEIHAAPASASHILCAR